MNKHVLSIVSLIFIFISCDTDAELTFQDWDENNDGMISQAEYDETEPYYNLFEQWDLDEDGNIDMMEFEKSSKVFYEDRPASDLGSFEQWDSDSDGGIDTGEFATSIFNLWDENSDGTLSEEEFESWYPEY